MTTPVDQRSSTTIAMTTPVDTRASAQGWTVSFTMPSEYAIDELPRPGDTRVKLREIPASYFAALRFSGQASTPVFEGHQRALRLAVEAAGLSARDGDSPVYAQYDQPWTPRMLRRNEVMIELHPAFFSS
jgi:hypothetical protein